MLSLWNPLTAEGKKMNEGGDGGQKATVQTHLCLMPDQLGIIIRYGWVLVLTMTVLLGRAVKVVLFGGKKGGGREGNGSLLPMARVKSRPEPPSPTKMYEQQPHSASSSTSDHAGGNGNGLSVRSKQRAHSPMSGGYGYKPPVAEVSVGAVGGKAWEDIPLSTSPSIQRGVRAVWLEFRRSVAVIGIPVAMWYIWLLRHS